MTASRNAQNAESNDDFRWTEESVRKKKKTHSEVLFSFRLHEKNKNPR